MSSTYVGLREFKGDELIFDDQETIDILKFIFNGYIGEAQFESLRVTDQVRSFAQGLLVEAVDASYAMGYVEALFLSSANPAAGARKALSKFGRKALKHWFKNIGDKDLQDIKIYESVRKTLARNFKSYLSIMMISAKSISGKFVAHVDYGVDADTNNTHA